MNNETQVKWAEGLLARRDDQCTDGARQAFDDYVSDVVFALEDCGVDLSAFKNAYTLMPE